MTTQRSESGGGDPLVRLVGRGDVVKSISYQDSPFGGGITIGGESPCALDDAPGRGVDGDDLAAPSTSTPGPEPDDVPSAPVG